MSQTSLLSRYQEFSSLWDFLDFYTRHFKYLRNAQDFEDLTWEYLTRIHQDNVKHVEFFFAPQDHTASLEDIISGINMARKRALHEYGMSSLLICEFLGHLGVDSALALLDSLEPYVVDGTIGGIGLVGAVSLQEFEPLYSHPLVDEYGLLRTAHAAEEGDTQQIFDAIRYLKVDRIDHGIKVCDNDEVLAALKESRIQLLAICPISNVKTGCVGKIEELPLSRLLDSGIRFSINSDDPGYFAGYIGNNYCALQEAFDWDMSIWIKIAEWSIEGSWVSEDNKSTLCTNLESFLLEWR